MARFNGQTPELDEAQNPPRPGLVGLYQLSTSSPAYMSKLYIFAAVFLFWTVLAASLLQVQLVASPMHKMRVPTYRSVSIRSTIVAQVNPISTAVSYN
jgi:hypothetical protein